MKQVYVPYWHWEDWKSGMWRKLPITEESEMLNRAIEFTGDHIKYGQAMQKVSKKWNMTMINGLTNQSINRRAFLGHCACSYKFKCPEYITRRAWKLLTENQRVLADHVAQQTIDEWMQEYMIRLGNISENGKKDATRMGYQMKLHLE